MTIDEYEPDNLILEINRKLANVTLQSSFDDESEYLSRSNLPTIKHALYSENPDSCLRGVRMLRKYLTQSSEHNQAHADDILSLEVLPRLRELLLLHQHSGVQFETAWIITNIGAGSTEQTTALLNADLIPALVECLTSKTNNLRAAWALSNFAGESAPFRELLANNHALVAVSSALNDAFDDIYEEARQHSYSDSEMSVVAPVLRTIINLTSGPDELSSRVLESSLVLRNISRLMQPGVSVAIRRDAFLVVSNFAASNLSVVERVMNRPDLIHSVLSHLHAPEPAYNERSPWTIPTESRKGHRTQEEWGITKECLWILCNLTTLATDENLCLLLSDYPTLPSLLGGLLHYIYVPHNACIKAIDLIINLIARTNQLTEVFPPLNPRPANPIVREFIDLGVREILPTLCEVSEKWSVLYERCAVLSSMLGEAETEDGDGDIASQFGLQASKYKTTGANKRRVLRGLEDGDVRLIENALNTISISERE
ncbi:hypothetical protein DFQ28_006327 [Apophysomyces sp. BC1034]|nr:hypothetical protein DFQ28_006327 [Apophysomyces sp. BC1034]